MSETVYSQLSEEQKAVSIPYYIHEGEMERMTRVNKRLWIALIIVILLFVGTNAGWIIYENQYQTYYVQQEVDTGNGSAYVSGVGDVSYGESKTDSASASAENQPEQPNEAVPDV